MAVSIAYYSVVVQIKTIASRFPGGLAGYRAACPNLTWCADEHISRIGFMAFEDVERFVHMLERAGIRRTEIAVTRQDRGLIEPRDWLETGIIEGRPIAWRSGTIPETVVVPESDLNVSVTPPIRSEELGETHEKLGVEDGVEIYRHRETGEKVYVGRATPRTHRRHWWWPFGRS
jgi:hypothetical protein